MWCIQQITPEYRKRMYRLLDLYKEGYDPLHPLVCMDEKSKQLLADNRKPIAARPGSLEKYDYEYKRKGTCNIFMAIVPKEGMRYTKVTDTRTKRDFAYFVLDLVDEHFSKSEYIQLVMDNLNTHFEGSLIETFGKQETERLMKKLRFIYTPKHASWLNMAEIEINIMDRQCTGTRIESKEKLAEDLEKWTKERNENKCTIEWKFTRQDADKKLSKHYVS
ncbi:DDE superfamily endonuclease [Niabella drilacis]|uniref:DDE superfamily endonuclease n=1 Tax=Niabella drilacis (strain DSM 25811 / CCM 8410 / CCUG 62505 / LMG 26954 / E90) TaxID=1285928 RepID=A0A1G7C1X9_NIADE|nr:DDE superfamily endonuclease [Niabella drilacis]SDE33307.1 DDE superfamily endonuclease [Niabella drilacis]